MERKSKQDSSTQRRRSKRKLLNNAEASNQDIETVNQTQNEREISTPSPTIKVRIMEKETMNDVRVVSTLKTKKSKAVPSINETIRISIQDKPITNPISYDYKERATGLDSVAVESPNGQYSVINVQMPVSSEDQASADVQLTHIKREPGVSSTQRSILRKTSLPKGTNIQSINAKQNTGNAIKPRRKNRGESNKGSMDTGDYSDVVVNDQTPSQDTTVLWADVTDTFESSIDSLDPLLHLSETDSPTRLASNTSEETANSTKTTNRDEAAVIVDVPNSIMGLDQLPGVDEQEKIILEVLPYMKEGDTCLPFCKRDCKVNHHPILIALNQCKSGVTKIDQVQRLFVLETLINYYNKKVNMELD